MDPKVFNGKDKLFFNANYERFRQVTRGNNYYTVPSLAMRQGNFSELLPPSRSMTQRRRFSMRTARPFMAIRSAGIMIPIDRQSPQAGRAVGVLAGAEQALRAQNNDSVSESLPGKPGNAEPGSVPPAVRLH